MISAKKFKTVLDMFVPDVREEVLRAYNHTVKEHGDQVSDLEAESNRFSDRLREQGLCLGSELVASAINIKAIIEASAQVPYTTKDIN